MTPLLAEFAEMEREPRIPVALRDTPMPKLISGELRGKNADKFIGEAA